MAELSDDEIARLRKAEEDSATLRSEHAALSKKHQENEQALAQAKQKYDNDMRQVAAYLQQQNQHPPAKDDDEDPDAIVSRKDLRKAQEQAEQRAAATSAQHANLLLRNQRNINKQLAVQRLGAKAEKYLSEIDAHLDKLDPAVAAQPTAYDEVFRYVRAAHFDEELEEARQAREQAESEDGGDSAANSASAAASSRPVPREPVSVSSSATAARPISRSAQAQRPRLTEEQRRVAAGFGMTDEQYAGDYGSDDVMVQNDPWGFKGRSRV